MPEELKQFELVYDESTRRYTIQVACSEPIPEGKTFCRKCSKIVDKDHIVEIKTEWGKTTMCKDCYDNNYEKCPMCGKSIHKDNMNTHKMHDGNEIRCCHSCTNEYLRSCVSCGSMHLHDSPSLKSIDDDLHCEECLNKKLLTGKIIKCPDCGEYTTRPTNTDVGDKRVCPNCYKDYIPINEYSYKPKPKFKGKGKTRYGFELELQVPDDRRREDIAKMIRDGFMYCKHDGSIGHGFEIVSHPFTEEWFYQNVGVFDKIWELRKIGCDAFHNNLCGMHVHITKEFSHLEIFKMMNIMYSENHYGFWKKISRRRKSEYERWCSSTNKNERIIKNDAKFKGRGDNKYTALNMTNNTIECRIFRSTLSKDMFIANLEMMFALTNFVKSGKSLRASSLDDFQKFIYNSKYEYAKKLVRRVTSTRTILSED